MPDILPKNNNNNKKKPQIKFSMYWMYAFILLFLFAMFYFDDNSVSEEVNYTKFQDYITNPNNVANHGITKIMVDRKKGKATAELSDSLAKKIFSNNRYKEGSKFSITTTLPSTDDFARKTEEWNKLGIYTGEVQYEDSSDYSTILWTFGPIVLFIAFWFFLMKRMTNRDGGASGVFNVGKSKAQIFDKDGPVKVTFKDVAGLSEAKQEIEEIVEFLKNPQRYTNLGGKIPKGALLVGPPGTGKTLLAKAVAGEAGAPFLSISGSDFVEMYVGVGASRVRDLFEQAKKKSPCIVFIDEIDAVGRHRGTGMGGGNDEREQTLNQLLVEMDGFGSNSGVIVIAATNRPDVLDPALLRPGRFDRQITVNRPDKQGREDILKVHAKGKPLGPDVDLKEVAKDTIGFTGADLENLMNEAALLAVRRNKKAISYQDIVDATSRVELGTEKKSHKYSEKAKKLTAYHEAGHAVASYYVEGHDPVREISIVPRGLGAGGYTWYTPQEENYNSRNDMLNDLISMFGGRVAEAVALDDISTGASNDLQRATEIVRDMVVKYGMSDDLGPVVYDSGNGEVFLGKDYGHVNNYSEQTSARIDSEVEKIMREAYAKTMSILKEHYDKLELVAETLIKKEKISGEEFENLMKNGALEVEAVETSTVELPQEQTETENE